MSVQEQRTRYTIADSVLKDLVNLCFDDMMLVCGWQLVYVYRSLQRDKVPC